MNASSHTQETQARHRFCIFGLLSLVAGVALVVSQFRSYTPAVGPELITDAGMLGMLFAFTAIICGAVGLFRREQHSYFAVTGAVSPFVVLIVEAAQKGKLW